MHLKTTETRITMWTYTINRSWDVELPLQHSSHWCQDEMANLERRMNGCPKLNIISRTAQQEGKIYKQAQPAHQKEARYTTVAWNLRPTTERVCSLGHSVRPPWGRVQRINVEPPNLLAIACWQWQCWVIFEASLFLRRNMPNTLLFISKSFE